VTKWPADRVERWAIDRVIPFARNARTHSEAQVAQVAASMKEWGWTNPILVAEDGTIIAGHARVLAARQLGLREVPVMIAEGWSDAQKRAYVLADNQLALNAGWDIPILQNELAELAGWDFDLSLLGFENLDALLASQNEGLTDPDEVPEPPTEPVTRQGDLWILGNHRLLCGDATVATDVDRVLGGVKPLLMVTDPPYGVDYKPEWRNSAFGDGNRAIGEVKNDGRCDWREAWALFPGNIVYQWHPAGAMQIDHADALIAAGFEIRMQIIWAKPRFVIGRGNYHLQHEPCWYAVRKGTTGHWAGDRSQSTLWQIEHRKSETGHGTQKPVECMRRPIVNNSSPGQAVYDPFVGSGTTIIAAEKTGRSCLAIDIDPIYVDVAVQRWQNFSGMDAVLDGDSRQFSELAKERLGAKVAA
jgi:DNA modification methylase